MLLLFYTSFFLPLYGSKFKFFFLFCYFTIEVYYKLKTFLYFIGQQILSKGKKISQREEEEKKRLN